MSIGRPNDELRNLLLDMVRRIEVLENLLKYVETREAITESEIIDLVNDNFAYAEIYDDDNAVAVTVATGAAYTKVNTWVSNGESQNVTPDAANNKITLDNTGIYYVSLSASFKSATANVNVLGAIFLDGVEIDEIHFRRKIGTANDEGVVSATGFVNVDSAGEDLDLRLRHDSGGNVDITITYANLSVIKMGLIP